MSWDTIMAVAVAVFAVAGFLFLAKTLWSVWRQKGWMADSTKTGDADLPPATGTSWDWEDNECYRECMDRPSPGLQNQYRHCAAACGLQ